MRGALICTKEVYENMNYQRLSSLVCPGQTTDGTRCKGALRLGSTVLAFPRKKKLMKGFYCAKNVGLNTP